MFGCFKLAKQKCRLGERTVNKERSKSELEEEDDEEEEGSEAN